VLSSGQNDDSTKPDIGTAGSRETSIAPVSSSTSGFDSSNLESKIKYLLDVTHSDNQTKATWYKLALGFDQSNWNDLASQIKFDESIAVQQRITEYGTVYEQSINIRGANGREINSPFIFMKDSDGVVRLITGKPAKK
jgi:filamentous hemagglutinin